MTHDTPSATPAPASATDPMLATCWQADGDCDCGAPMTTDGRSVWCVRGRQCPNARPQCDHGLPLDGPGCEQCDVDMDAAPSLLTLARHYAAEWPHTDVGRLARAWLALSGEGGVE